MKNISKKFVFPIFLKFDFFLFFWANFDFSRYGQATPPSYDLSLVKEKVRIYFGTGDATGSPQSISELGSSLSKAPTKTFIIQEWGHFTYMIAKNPGPILDIIGEIKTDI